MFYYSTTLLEANIQLLISALTAKFKRCFDKEKEKKKEKKKQYSKINTKGNYELLQVKGINHRIKERKSNKVETKREMYFYTIHLIT